DWLCPAPAQLSQPRDCALAKAAFQARTRNMSSFGGRIIAHRIERNEHAPGSTIRHREPRARLRDDDLVTIYCDGQLGHDAPNYVAREAPFNAARKRSFILIDSD